MKKIIIAALALLPLILTSCDDAEPEVVEQVMKEIMVDEQIIPSDATELDLSGADIDDLSVLYPLSNLQSLNLSDVELTTEDIAQLKANLPQCDILWSIPFGDSTYPSDTANIDLTGVTIEDIDSIVSALEQFASLPDITLTSEDISVDDLRTLQNHFDNIAYDIDVYLDNIPYKSSVAELDLSTFDISNVDGIIPQLGYFDELTTVDFGDLELTNEQKDILMAQYSNTHFIWNTLICERVISSSETEIDISNYRIEDYDAFSNTLKYLPNLTYADMCDCRLSNEDMEELQTKYPDIQFVWKIMVGSWELRTDAKAFSTGTRGVFDGGEYVGDHPFLSNKQVSNVKYCTDLIALDIGHQSAITEFQFLASMPNLEYLIIAMTGVEDLSCIQHMKSLIYLEVFTTDVDDLTPLLELPNLKHLNCSTSEFTSNEALLQLTQLERLWIVDSQLTEEDIKEVRAALPNTVIVDIARSPTHSGWRAKGCQVYIDMQELFGLKPLFSGE